MITAQLKESEYLAVVRFSRRWGIKMWSFTVISTLCYLVLGGSILLYAGQWRISTFWGIFLILMAPFPWALNAYSYYVTVPRRCRKIFHQQKGLQRSYTMQWDGEKLHIEGKEVKAAMLWSDFLKWRENDEFFLLYSSDVLFHTIPKRVFADPKAIAEFSQLLREKVGPENVRAR